MIFYSIFILCYTYFFWIKLYVNPSKWLFFSHIFCQVYVGSLMALTEASNNLLPLSNGGVPQSMSATMPSEPAGSVAEATLDTSENTDQKARTVSKMDLPRRNSVTQNCSFQPSLSSTSPTSAFLSPLGSTKLLPKSLPHHTSACCPFQEQECCNGNQQDGTLFQGSIHSRRALHMGPCCVQGTPNFCMQQQWQECFPNQSNMTTFR